MRSRIESALVCSLLAAAACGGVATTDPLTACGAAVRGAAGITVTWNASARTANFVNGVAIPGRDLAFQVLVQ